MPRSDKRIRVAVAQTAEGQLSALFQVVDGASDMEALSLTAPPEELWKLVMGRSPDVAILYMPEVGAPEKTIIGRILSGSFTRLLVLTDRPLPEGHGLRTDRVDVLAVPPIRLNSARAAGEILARIRGQGGGPAVQPPLRPAAAAAPGTADPRLAGRIIAIGASTGGTEALAKLFHLLPTTALPGIVVVQHMPPVFTEMYAQRLNKELPFDVCEARDNVPIAPGSIHIAPGGRHLTIVKKGSGFSTRLTTTEKVNGHCPSVDVLFESVAREAHDKAAGVILTGMGADGAAGMLSMRRQGAYTIGQDEASCVVYGMPRKAFENGSVARQAPLTEIAGVLMTHLRQA